MDDRNILAEVMKLQQGYLQETPEEREKERKRRRGEENETVEHERAHGASDRERRAV